MISADLIWIDTNPPAMENPPDFNDPSKVFDEIRKLEDQCRKNIIRVGGILSHIWHGKWMVSTEHPRPDLANMSRWLLSAYNIDLGPSELRARILPFDTFVPFGTKVQKWIEAFAPSTAFELARAARFVLNKDPLLMTNEERDEALIKTIEKMIVVCPFGTGVRDVFPKLSEAGLLPANRRSGKTRTTTSELGLLDELALSEDGVVDGMFIIRQKKRRNPAIEKEWAKVINAYCDKHDIDRDEAWRRLMDVGMEYVFNK